MPSIAGMLSSIGPTWFHRLGAQRQRALEGALRIGDAERHGAGARTVLRGENRRAKLSGSALTMKLMSPWR